MNRPLAIRHYGFLDLIGQFTAEGIILIAGEEGIRGQSLLVCRGEFLSYLQLQQVLDAQRERGFAHEAADANASRKTVWVTNASLPHHQAALGEPEQHGLFDRKTESTGEHNQIELLRNLKLRGALISYCWSDSPGIA